MIEYDDDVLKQLFPIGTVVVYNENLFKKLEKIYTMENLIGTQLYIIKERKEINK